MIGRAFHWLWAYFMALLLQCRIAIVALANPEGRRGWALVALWGAGVAMTIYAIRSQWFVRFNPSYSFWLGVMAHISLIIVITGFAGLLVKRNLHGKITGIAEFGVDDEERQNGTSTTEVNISKTTTNDTTI